MQVKLLLFFCGLEDQGFNRFKAHQPYGIHVVEAQTRVLPAEPLLLGTVLCSPSYSLNSQLTSSALWPSISKRTSATASLLNKNLLMHVHLGLPIHKQEGNFLEHIVYERETLSLRSSPGVNPFSLLVRKDAPGNHGLLALIDIRENIWSEKEASPQCALWSQGCRQPTTLAAPLKGRWLST